MMDWQVDIPHYGDRDGLVLEAISAAKEKFGEGDQRTRVVEVLANDALFNGVTTVGQLIDGLGALDRAGVRARLDWARGELGLPSTGEVEQRRADFLFDAEFQRLQPPPPPRWSPLQTCAICGVYPTKDGGALAEVTVEKWHCPAHEHLAAEGDMAEHERAIIGLSPTGAPVYSEAERRRRAEWARQRDGKHEREVRQREEHERRQAEVIEEAKRRFADEGEISVMGIRTRPDLRVIEP